MAILEGAIESGRGRRRQVGEAEDDNEGGAHNILCDLGNRWGVVGAWSFAGGGRGCRSFLLPWLVAVFLRANTLGVGKRCVIYKFMSVFWHGLWLWWVPPPFLWMSDVCLFDTAVSTWHVAGPRHVCPGEFRSQDTA